MGCNLTARHPQDHYSIVASYVMQKKEAASTLFLVLMKLSKVQIQTDYSEGRPSGTLSYMNGTNKINQYKY